MGKYAIRTFSATQGAYDRVKTSGGLDKSQKYHGNVCPSFGPTKERYEIDFKDGSELKCIILLRQRIKSTDFAVDAPKVKVILHNVLPQVIWSPWRRVHNEKTGHDVYKHLPMPDLLVKYTYTGSDNHILKTTIELPAYVDLYLTGVTYHESPLI